MDHSVTNRSLLVLYFVVLVIILASSSTSRSTTSYALFHRIGPTNLTQPEIHPTGPDSGWQQRGVLEILSSASDLDGEDDENRALGLSIASFSKSSDPLVIPHHPSNTLQSWSYHLSLVPLGDPLTLAGEPQLAHPGLAINSFPLCAFNLGDDLDPNEMSPVKEYLNVWLRPRGVLSRPRSDERSSMVIHLDLLGIQWSSSLSTSSPIGCPPSTPQQSQDHPPPTLLSARLDRLALLHGHSNIQISVRQPERLSEPMLVPYPVEKPPEFLADGSIKPPPVEKGWLAKYWMYILPLVVMLVVGGGSPPPDESADHQQSSSAVKN